MKYLQKTALLATVLAISANAAMADVTILDKLSGTGDNVVFDSQNGGLILGTFNGQNQGTVDFTDLSGNPLFVGAQNGNDIKIANTSDLQVQVFDTTNTSVLPTATDVFSLKGTGDVTVFVTANESGGGTKLFTFDLGQIDPNAQSGFTLTAINGETINLFTLLDVGGTVTDFEHYRIDVAASAVPEPATWAMMLLGFIGLGFAFRSRRRLARLA
jgi:hypothetical protein